MVAPQLRVVRRGLYLLRARRHAAARPCQSARAEPLDSGADSGCVSVDAVWTVAVADASYSDPLGADPLAQRPRTAAFRQHDDDMFDDELGDDLLPE